MSLKHWLMVAGVSAALAMSASDAWAQQNNRGNRQGGPGGPGGNFDPAQMRQRMMERYKEMLEVTSDDEWKAIQPLVEKVQDSRMASMSGMGRGMFGRGRQGGDNQGGGRPQGGMFGQQPNPAADALEKAIEAKASKAELKAAVAKYQETRKAKQAELEAAQENLRKVLTARQEAIATLNGLL